MPTKLKGMTSLEIAIIVAIVLIIAVAVGWYLYTTFIATAGGQPRLNVVSAEITSSNRELKLRVVNPGPVDVKVENAEVAGETVRLTCEPVSQDDQVQNNVIKVGSQAECTGRMREVTATPGTILPGKVISSSGHSFLFNAGVRP